MFRLYVGSKPINLGCGLILLVVVLVEVWTLGERVAGGVTCSHRLSGEDSTCPPDSIMLLPGWPIVAYSGVSGWD